MRSSFVATTGLKLTRSPTARELAARRWAAVGVGLAALVLAGGVLGALTAPHSSMEPSMRTGPFSYFPSE